MADNDFDERVLKNIRLNQKNQILFVYLDSQIVAPYETKETDVWLPQLGGSWHRFLNDYSKYHGFKKSRSVEIEKIKVKGKPDFLKFKFLKKIDKKATPNKSRPKSIPEGLYYGRPA